MKLEAFLQKSVNVIVFIVYIQSVHLNVDYGGHLVKVGNWTSAAGEQRPQFKPGFHGSES
jgi:hypothetical protein